MKVLVTGGSGFLGRAVVRALESQGLKSWVLSRSSGDLREPLHLPGGPYDRVIHLAGLAHAPRASGSQFQLVNAKGTRHLLEALARCQTPPRLITFASSVSVYGAREGELLDEESPLRPDTPYGKSKLEAEKLLKDFADQFQVKLTIVRLPLVAGMGAPGNFGSMVTALEKGRYLGVGSGRARRSMISREDAARFLAAPPEKAGIYHLTDGHHPSFLELEQSLCQLLGRTLPWRIPEWLARCLGWSGDLLEKLCGRSPVGSAAIQKMTSSLTFCDRKARGEIDWTPAPVTSHLLQVNRSAFEKPTV